MSRTSTIAPRAGAFAANAAMRAILCCVLLAMAATGCTGERLAPFTRLARAFAQAAVERDSATLRSLAAGEPTVERMLMLAQTHPGMVRAAGEQLRPIMGEVRADTASVEFRVPGSGYAGTIGFQFFRKDREWRVSGVQLSDNF